VHASASASRAHSLHVPAEVDLGPADHVAITFQAGDPSRPTSYLRTDVRRLILPESLDARGRTLPGGGANPSMSFTANYIVFDSPAPLGAVAGVHEIYMRYLGGT
jgi:hypothetical protein